MGRGLLCEEAVGGESSGMVVELGGRSVYLLPRGLFGDMPRGASSSLPRISESRWAISAATKFYPGEMTSEENAFPNAACAAACCLRSGEACSGTNA